MFSYTCKDGWAQRARAALHVAKIVSVGARDARGFVVPADSFRISGPELGFFAVGLR